MAQFQGSESVQKDKNLFKVIAPYLKYWWAFLLAAVIGIVAAFLYIRYQTRPEYWVSSTIMLENLEEGQGVDAQSLSNFGLIKPSRSIEDEIGIIKSYNVMEKVVNNLSLDVAYYFPGKFSELEIYASDFPIKILLDKTNPPKFGGWLSIKMKDGNTFSLGIEGPKGDYLYSDHVLGDEIHKPFGTFTVVSNSEQISENQTMLFRFQNTQQLADGLRKKLAVAQVNKSGNLLTIGLADALPKRGKDIVNEVIRVYIQETVNFKNQMATTTIEMLDNRLKLLTGEISDVEKNVEIYKQENDVTNVSSDAQLYLQSATQYQQRVQEYNTQLEVLNSIENYIKRQGDDSLVPSSLSIQDAALMGLVANFNELQLRRRSLLRTTPEENPLVVELNRQISDLRANILQTLTGIKGSLEIARNNVQSSSWRYQSQMAKVPSVERELTEINRQQSTKEGLYLFLLQKREEETLSLAAPINSTRIVDEARSTSYPVSPNKTSIYMGSLLLGLLIPFSIVFIKDKLNIKIQTAEELKELTQVQFIGEISQKNSDKILVVSEKSHEPVTELFRLLRFNLKYATSGQPNKVILVTSTKKGEGKTFFSINLAASMAQAGEKVVVLGLDLRDPKLMKDLHIPYKKGITDYIIDTNLKSKDLLKIVPEVDNLYAIGSGQIPPNPAKLMLSERITRLIEELKQEFDHIILDATPVGVIADTFSLVSMVDSSVYVTKSNYTTKDDVAFLNDVCNNGKLKNPMLVLNGTKLSKKHGYGYGYAYNYGKKGTLKLGQKP